MPHTPNDLIGPISLGVMAFTAFMPDLTEIRASDVSDPTMGKNLRIAEYAAAFVVIGSCAIIAAWSHEYYPLIVAGITVIGLIYLFETVYRTTPNA